MSWWCPAGVASKTLEPDFRAPKPIPGDALQVRGDERQQSATAGFPYRVIRSGQRFRTIQLLVTREREVVVRAPVATSQREIAAMVEARAAWVLARIAALEAAPPAPVGRQFVTGERVFVDGNDVDLVVFAVIGAEPARLDGNRLLLPVPPGASFEARRELLARFYSERATAGAKLLVERWSAELRVQPTGVLARDQRRRWGSCGTNGVIRLNWRLAMLPAAVFEYVVVHELAHLKQANHSEAFWRIVDGVLPDRKARKATLREFERRIDW